MQATRLAEAGKQRYLSGLLHTLSRLLLTERLPTDPTALLQSQGHTPGATV